MSKKVREYKSGDFIFAKVKGYPAWPARVQKLNGKKYFVYFYGTGETANLPPTMIFDYAENKDKFLTKMVKRRDFNDGVKQIEHDFANNVPLEQVIGLTPQAADAGNNIINESANETMDDSTADTSAADETMTEENTTQNDTGIEDSDETGALVIDEEKAPVINQQKGRKSIAKTPAKEIPKAKEPKTPRGRPKKDDTEEFKEDEKKEEEIVSRSGRKIRPKRYIDEQTEENATLPSPAPKKRRGGSPPVDKDKEKEKEKDKPDPPKDKIEKNIKHFNAVPQSELENLKEPFTPDNSATANCEIKTKPKDLNPRSKQSKNKKFIPPLRNVANSENKIPKQDVYDNRTNVKNFDVILPIQSQNEFFDANDCLEIPKKVTDNICSDKPTKINLNKEFSLDGLILDSFNVLNDEDIQLYASQTSRNSETASQKTNKLDVLSRNNSVCSVISLNKTYKNLDIKSSENVQNQNGFLTCNDNNLNNDISQSINKKEPNDDFLKLFINENVNKTTKRVPMSTQFEDPEKENIIIAYLPSGQYIGIKLFQSRPTSFKNENARLQWDRQAASNALTLKMQLEKGQITAQSVMAQLVMDLNLTDEEKATLDKERETEEKKSRVQFLKTEMKLIELDAKIKTCLCLEKADTELCLKLLDELMELDVKPLMLLKHPTCLETVKRMRAYVGNTPSWDLSERAVLQFGQHALRIRRQADALYGSMRDLFTTPEGLSFWEFFMERVALFKKVTSKLSSDELLELVHEPLEMSMPTSHTMKASVEAANEEEQQEEDAAKKAKSTPAKTKKPNNATPKPPLKRQSSRKLEEKEKEKEKEKEQNTEETTETNATEKPVETEVENTESTDTNKDTKNDTESAEDKDNEVKDKDKKDSKGNTETEENETNKAQETEETSIENSKETLSEEEKKDVSKDKDTEEVENEDKTDKSDKEDKEKEKVTDKSDKEDKEKEKVEDEPRAKRTRESKKTDPPPRSPTKRKSKF
ncbi:unnamed protein product [Euphydryas editha]|uniref:PWWP domain-containing protein n=1 Tax=Euphydryas editha TaxID=104508 RepID=A0AAU9TF69_EUPED|nr:unnamed protein product [Euphydryas editha]